MPADDPLWDQCLALARAIGNLPAGADVAYIGDMGKMLRWRISRIRSSRAVVLGTVTAPTAAAAIRKAIEQFAITDPWEQQRLAARPAD